MYIYILTDVYSVSIGGNEMINRIMERIETSPLRWAAYLISPLNMVMLIRHIIRKGGKP